MKSSTKISLILFLIPILTCLTIASYYIKLTVTDNLRYKKDSIKYRLLTPAILKKFPAEDIGKVKHYYYSAADKNKPLINSIKLVSSKDKDYLEEKITRYFVNNQFTKTRSGELIKDNLQISVLFEKNNSNIWDVRITLLEIIK